MYPSNFDIGIQEEYQIISPETRELLGYVSRSMTDGSLVVQERDPETDLNRKIGEAMFAEKIPFYVDISEASGQLLRTRQALLDLVQAQGFQLMGAGTHPFSNWMDAPLLAPRYQKIHKDAQMVARRMLAFGLHVYIGVGSQDLAIDIMNTMRYFMPYLLSLATSSPFWLKDNTGLKSYRTVLFNALPRTGIPDTYPSYQAYRDNIHTLIQTGSITDAGKIWYDIMPSHRHPALLVRICDMLPNYKDTLAMAALIQAMVAWMVALRENNMAFRIYKRPLIQENKWRAVRYGIEGEMIDFGKEEPVETRALIHELLGRVTPMARRLNSTRALEHVATMLTRGTCADQQLAVWKESGEDFNRVVDFLAAETEKTA